MRRNKNCRLNATSLYQLTDFNDENFVLNTIDKARSYYNNINLEAINLANNFSISKMNQKYLKLLNEIS